MECNICLENKDVFMIPTCHKQHEICCDCYFSLHNKVCPNCRKDIDVNHYQNKKTLKVIDKDTYGNTYSKKQYYKSPLFINGYDSTQTIIDKLKRQINYF